MSELLYGFDTSLTHFGYAIALRETRDDLRFVVAGVFVTKPDRDAATKTGDMSRRFQALADQVFSLPSRYEMPTHIACEALALPWGKTSMQTISALGRARGLVDALAALARVRVVEYQPAHLKRLVTGDPKAEKAAVQVELERSHPELAPLLAQLHASNREHAADAAASIHALHAAHTTEE